MHSDFIVFADESGDHSLAKMNADYPVFVLSFCIFRKADYVESVCPLLQRFKLRWWAHDGVVLHSMRIKRQEAPSRQERRCGACSDLSSALRACESPRKDAGILDRILRNEGQSARAADRRSGQHAHWSKCPSSARTESRFPDSPAQVRSGAERRPDGVGVASLPLKNERPRTTVPRPIADREQPPIQWRAFFAT